MRAAVTALKRQKPLRIVIAVPTASPDVCDEFRAEVDEILCGMTPAPFHAVGAWYEDFSQTTDGEVLQLLTGHVETGARLPRSLFDKMIAARNFQSGFYTMRQLEFALFDMLLHAGPPPTSDGEVIALLDEVRREVAVLLPPEYNRFPHAFSHIFAGGYAAGYYSYKWAEVLSADAYSAFEEGGVLNPAIGRRFHDEILAVGGSRPAMQSFVAFRGRKPTIDALLRHHGMVN